MANKHIDVNYHDANEDIAVDADGTGPDAGHQVKVIFDDAADPELIQQALQRAQERLAEDLA